MVPEDQLEQIWTEIKSRLRLALPANVFRIWIEQLRPTGVSDGVLYLAAPDQTREWVRRRFGSLLSAAAGASHPSLTRAELISPETRSTRERRRALGPPRPLLKPAHSFSEFVIGAGNRFAHAAALAVAELPGQAYNPLFLHGPAGVGKTHLLQAIGNYLTLHDPTLVMRYATLESFTTHFTTAVQQGSTADFKREYRHLDVLLLDDVQFIEHKRKTAEELFHTFDALLDADAQVILASDRPPAEMPLLQSKLRDRFHGGLLIELETPDYDTRLAILRKRSGPHAPSSPGEATALEYLAQHGPLDARSLEGSLIRAHAFASLAQRSLSPEIARHVLTNLYPPSAHETRSTPTIEQIQRHTSQLLGLSLDDLLSPKRSRHVVYARQVAMYLSRELTSLSLPAIATSFHRRDHTTVLHAHRKIRQQALTNSSTRKLLEDVQTDLFSIPNP